MLSILKRAFEPSLPYPDSINFMTSVKYLQSVRADNITPVVEKIKDLLTTKSTRLQGLQFLEIALQQNSDIYLKGRWTSVLYDILKEPVSGLLKEHACKILCLIIPFMAKDTGANAMDIQKFASFLFPFLLSQIENNVEWIESAGICLCTCLKCFPQILEPHKERLLTVIFQQISFTVSSRTLEVFAECFSYIPSCSRADDPTTYAANWLNHYLTTLNSMHYLLNYFLSFMPDESIANSTIPNVGTHPFLQEDDEENEHSAYIKGIRRFINLCKCLAKMLSTKTKFAVQIPVKQTLQCISRLFQVQDMAKITTFPQQLDLIFSTFSQMQVAGLVVVESLMLNVNLVTYSFLISQMMMFALQASNLPNVSSESISPLRQAVWKLLDQWVSRHGAKVSADIVEQPSIIEELLKDISIENLSQTNTIAVASKSKKNTPPTNPGRKTFVNKNHQVVCKEALKTLENVLYSGSSFISKKLLQEILTKIVQIAYTISPQVEYPFPYDNDMCRKHLYSVLLAITVVSKTDLREPAQCASGIFKFALQDPSPKVIRVCHKAMAMCKLYLHPKKPMPVSKDSDDKPRRAPNIVVKFPEWTSEEYVQNFPPVENITEGPRIAQTFHDTNETEEVYEESMQVDTTYSEQDVDSQCNGEEDILDIQQTSHELDSDEEDEEEEEDHSYGEEEINHEEVQTEHLYIPSTSKVLNPVSVAPETEQDAGAQEYEELRPCGKNDDSNKNVHLNGVRSVVIEAEVSSPSAQNVTSENGIYDGFEEDDVDEEEGDEDEEEESGSYPAEKKVPEYLETPAAKKQKLEEPKEPQDSREESRSPTLVEMKADFCCNEIEDVKS